MASCGCCATMSKEKKMYYFNRVCWVDFVVTDINMCNLTEISIYPLDVGQWDNRHWVEENLIVKVFVVF